MKYMYKKILFISLILAISFVLVGCGKKEEGNQAVKQVPPASDQEASNETVDYVTNTASDEEEKYEAVGAVDLSESGLGSGAIPSINMDMDFKTSGMEMDIEAGEEALGDATVEFESPPVPAIEPFVFDPSALESELSQPQGAGDKKQGEGDAPPEEYIPTAEECTQFISAPDCSYVPVSARDLCNKCKN